MKRLFELREAGKLRSMLLPYLGQDDSRLKFRPADLITREEAFAYPTDFSAMSTESRPISGSTNTRPSTISSPNLSSFA
ncbi:MAG: patatin [Microvirga sp.]|jgi:hypothetical protein|nr:patatin [Microvirga sp.]